jgi:hypothetical protein
MYYGNYNRVLTVKGRSPWWQLGALPDGPQRGARRFIRDMPEGDRPSNRPYLSEGARPFFVTVRGQRRVDERVGTGSQNEYYKLKRCYWNIFVVKNERKVTKMGRVAPLKTGEFT